MTAPFVHLITERSNLSESEIVEQAFSRMNKWAMISGAKLVSLDEVAWLGAVLYRSVRHTGMLEKFETKDENGARVVGVVASDGVPMSDGAG